MNNNDYQLIYSWFRLLEDNNNNIRSFVNSNNNIFSLMYRNHNQNMDMTYQIIDRISRLHNNRNTNTNTNTQRNFSYSFPFTNTTELFPPNRHRHFNIPSNNIFSNLPSLNRQPLSQQLSQQLSRPNINLFTNNNNNNLTPNSIPSTMQILNSITISKWSDISSNADQPICPITQDSFNDDEDVIKINNCGHIFKKNSLLRWFERSSLCPVCRYNIITENFGTTQENRNNNFRNLATSIINNLTRDISNNLNDTSGNIVLATVEVETTSDLFSIPPPSPINLNTNSVGDISNNDLSNNVV